MSSNSDSDAGVLSDQSDGELKEDSRSPSPAPERQSRERARTPPLISSSSLYLSRYYRERFGSHSPEDYLNLRFTKIDPILTNEKIKQILDEELEKLMPFEVKLTSDNGNSKDRIAYVNFRKNNCAKTVRRALIPRLHERLGPNLLVDPAGILRDQEGKFVPDKFNRAQIGDGRDQRNNNIRPNAHFNNLNQDNHAATRTLFVGNLPGDIRFNELHHAFTRYGSVEDIDIKFVNDGIAAYAFVVFHNLDSAIDALHGLHNKSIRMGSHRCQIGYGKSQVSSRLWLGRLGSWASRDLITRECERFGTVDHVDFNHGDHHAYVKFLDTDTAKDAFSSLKNFALDGRHKIVVDYAKDRENRMPKRDNNVSNTSGYKRRGHTHGSSQEREREREEPVRKRARTPEEPKSEPEIDNFDDFNEKFPSTWKGFLCLKKTEYNIKLHRVWGKENLLQDLMRDDDGSSFKLKVDQRLPRETGFLDKIYDFDQDKMVFMIGVETTLSFTPFIQYMDEKNAVGVVSLPAAQLFILPHSTLTTTIIQKFIPKVNILSKNTNYLLLVLQAS